MRSLVTLKVIVSFLHLKAVIVGTIVVILG
jgi:hypothetical protein